MPLRHFNLIVFLSFAGFCFAQTPTPGPEKATTGIEGLMRIAPIHPGPARPGIQSSGPLANATFIATKQGGSANEFTTDDQGHFKILLEPGQYTITRKDQTKGVGRCGPFDSFVAAGQMTRVEWQCDSGMR